MNEHQYFGDIYFNEGIQKYQSEKKEKQALEKSKERIKELDKINTE